MELETILTLRSIRCARGATGSEVFGVCSILVTTTKTKVIRRDSGQFNIKSVGTSTSSFLLGDLDTTIFAVFAMSAQGRLRRHEYDRDLLRNLKDLRLCSTCNVIDAAQ